MKQGDIVSNLNLQPDELTAAPKKKINKTLKVLLGITALLAIPLIGRTFASTITINSGTVEFAQGDATTAGCDESISTKAASVYSSSFKLGKITLGGIDVDGCKGKTFTVSIAKSDGAEANLISTDTQVSFKIPASAGSPTTLESLSPATGFTTTFTNGGSAITSYSGVTDGEITITFDTPSLASSDVVKVLLQTS